MDRQIIYPGQIPLDTDLLNTNKNALVALGKLAGATLGTAPVVNGLAVTPTSPSSLNIQVAPGEIYALQNIDNSAYGSLVADTADQIVKQGILLAVATLSCPAPGTAGLSINYLIQAAFSETDGGAVALPYYNASNPAQAWSGANNNGTPQPTVRQNQCVVSVIAGAAASTGTQTTPAPTGSAIGLAVVTVANGQANITSANISQYAGASLVPQNGLASNVMHAIYSKSVAGNTDVTLTAQEAAYPLLTLTGALTGNINLIVPAVSRQRVINNQTTGAGYNVTVKTAAGTGLAVPQGQTLSLYCDGVNVLNESSASLMPSPYADATGTSEALTASYSVNNTTLYDGYPLSIGIGTSNATTTPTFAPTLNGVAQTARAIVKFINNAPVPLAPGDLQGDAELRYDLPNTRWVLQNPGSSMGGQMAIPYADATGAADAVTASYTVANPTLADGYPLSLGIATPNATTTPTFAPTLNGTAQTARTVVKFINNAAVALVAGDLQGSVILQYDLPNTRWILLNPGSVLTPQFAPTITATVAANALTIGASPFALSFRSATLGSGAISSMLAAPANLVIPAGATLGTVNSIQSRIIVLELLNAGVAELAVVNVAGGVNLDETTLITTTAISAAATAANVIYSTTGRATVPFRVIGYVESTQATAGTWTSAPSTIQGAGGNALTGMSGLGYGQSWQNVTGSRALATTYYNTTGKPIQVSVSIGVTVNGITISLSVNGVVAATESVYSNSGFLTAIVPPGASYVTTSSNQVLSAWSELR